MVKLEFRAQKDFTNLNEGYYTFYVKARNVYGVESNVAQFSFNILPPWYRTIYAYLGYVLILLLVVIAIVKIYTRRLIAEKERLERIVAERTAEVVAQKEEIEAQSEKIFQQNEHIKVVLITQVKFRMLFYHHLKLLHAFLVITSYYICHEI